MKQLYKLIILITICCAAMLKANAQQEPTYTLYRYYSSFFNPSAIGLEDKVTFQSNFRSAFLGIPDAPETQSFYVTVPINDKINVGVNAIADQLFIENTTSLFASISYSLQLSASTDLIFGVQAGGSFVNINFDRINLPTDPLFSQNISDFNPNVGVGFYLNNDKYFASLSSPRLLSTDRVDDTNGVVTSANNELQIYLSGGYHFDLSKSVKFTPSALVRFFDSETAVDLTGTFKFIDRIEVGANYRIDEAFGGLLYFTLKDWLEIGYAYEANSSDIDTFEDGTHEIGLTLKF